MFRVLTLLFVLSVGLVAHAQSQAQGPKAPASAAKPAAPKAPASAARPAAPPAAAERPAASQTAAAAPAATPAALTDEEKTVYALGLLMQRSIRQFDLSPEEIEIIKRALIDGGAGTPAVDLTEWGPKVEPFANARGARAMTREKAASAAYLENAAAELGAVRTASGLVYRDLAVGSGPSPTASDRVQVNYRGALINGTVFDSSYERNEPATFLLGGVVPCWTEGVQRMKVGGKARLVCPSDLAYGDAGAPAIPGGAALVFDVELLGIIAR